MAHEVDFPKEAKKNSEFMNTILIGEKKFVNFFAK